MKYLVDDFYNSFVSALHKELFPELKYLKDSEVGCKIAYAVELFNNGVFSIHKTEREIAKFCKVSVEKVQEIRKQFLILDEEV